MKKLLFIIFIYQLTISIFSQSYEIRDIKVQGLKRTKYNTVLNILDVKKGDVLEVSTIDVLKQKLLKAGIFTNQISVDLNPIDENFAVLDIEVEDKWTLIPLPFFSYSQDSLAYGGLFIESNLLGMKHSLISGVFYNDGNLASFGVWVLPKKNKNTLSFSISLNQGDKNRSDFYGETVNIIDNNIFGGGVNYTRDITDEVNARVTLRAMSKNGETTIDNNYQFTFDNTNIGDYFTTGLKSTLGYNSEYLIESSDYYKSVNLELQLGSLLFNNLLSLIMKSTYSLDKNNYYSLFGAKKGSLIIPKNDIHINSALYGQFTYELKVFDLSWGYITIPLFYEAGIIESHGDKTVYGYHGPGSGLNLYMKKAAIPAMGIFYIYDVIKSRYNFSFSIGAAF